jgi:hypothetical protein
MGLISEGIEQVVAFRLPVSMGEDGGSLCASREALVRWKSSWQDKFHQVYINGSFGGVTSDAEQRQMVVQLPTSFLSSVRIEVFAVSGSEADTDFSSHLEGSTGQSGRVKISLLREQKLPADSRAEIYFDNGTGQIDMANPLNNELLWIWPMREDKAGFGMSGFGLSDFGYDWSGAAGFGKGCFGIGQFGSDADLFEWLSGRLSAGAYRFAAKIFDEVGRESSTAQTGEIVVMPSAKGAERLTVFSFDKAENKLELRIEN